MIGPRVPTMWRNPISGRSHTTLDDLTRCIRGYGYGAHGPVQGLETPAD